MHRRPPMVRLCWRPLQLPQEFAEAVEGPVRPRSVLVGFAAENCSIADRMDSCYPVQAVEYSDSRGLAASSGMADPHQPALDDRTGRAGRS